MRIELSHPHIMPVEGESHNQRLMRIAYNLAMLAAHAPCAPHLEDDVSQTVGEGHGYAVLTYGTHSPIDFCYEDKQNA